MVSSKVSYDALALFLACKIPACFFHGAIYNVMIIWIIHISCPYQSMPNLCVSNDSSYAPLSSPQCVFQIKHARMRRASLDLNQCLSTYLWPPFFATLCDSTTWKLITPGR